jgi:hypothetical protein
MIKIGIPLLVAGVVTIAAFTFKYLTKAKGVDL